VSFIFDFEPFEKDKPDEELAKKRDEYWSKQQENLFKVAACLPLCLFVAPTHT
jgi:hypothetical protein